MVFLQILNFKRLGSRDRRGNLDKNKKIGSELMSPPLCTCLTSQQRRVTVCKVWCGWGFPR